MKTKKDEIDSITINLGNKELANVITVNNMRFVKLSCINEELNNVINSCKELLTSLNCYGISIESNQFQKRIDDIIVELKQSNPYKKGFLAKFNKDKKTGKLVLSSNHKVWNDCCKELEKILKEGEY